ncbi:MAG: hypothetical protein WGN25_16035 [Candidatus Electrothrix sp. GW3-4]|uniref:hypothetical protein n=1 Tax=Candidatus Electrothrix sp. GW3-4 TaxID=3126740 RepID=UPI0030D59BAA
MKKISVLTTGILALFLVAGSTSAFARASGIIAQGEFSVYKKGKLTKKMSGTTPVTEEALLVCEGKCLLKTTGIALVVQDGTEMAVKKGPDRFNLMVMNGLVDFSLTDQAGKMAFYTADGQYTVGDPMFNTSTANAVRGYMQIADDGRARVGLHEGRMVFSTGEGAKTINSNEYILLKAEAKTTPSTTGVAATEVGPAGGAIGGWSWFGFGPGTIFTTCTVVTMTTVTTVSKSKGSGKNPYKNASKGSKKSSNGTTVTKTTTTTKTTTGTTKTTTKTKTKGSVKVTRPWPPKGSKGMMPPKGSKGTIIVQPWRPLPPPPWQPCSTCPPPCCPPPSPST